MSDYVLGPLIQLRSAKAPELTDLDGWDFTLARHPLEGLGMNLEEFGGLGAIEQWFKALALEIMSGYRFLLGWIN